MAKTFEPIAIVGQACLLPGASSPDELWRAVAAGRDLLSAAPEGRWGLSAENAIGTLDRSADRSWSDRGGYVEGFEHRFDPKLFAIPPAEIEGLDPLFQWVLHCAREALRDAGQDDTSRTGAIFGNLSFPSSSMSRYAERVWLGDERADTAGVPRVAAANRFMSGLPAHTLGRALELGDVCYALDAACASSLYALKLACDRLHDRTADVMLAGAVNRADDLFIHVGFCALKALSQTGRSRPFHAAADGLVPAEGAAFLTLKRLADAERDGDRVHGVIRGVGLSNDGRGKGLLAPAEEGQERAMLQAYAASGLEPRDIQLIECHATGTTVGDATELGSMARVFEGLEDVPIGSLKSNLGHLITAAGVAGIIKVLAAMTHEVRPPTLHVDQPHESVRRSPFRLLTEAEPWPSDGPRRGAVSAFGFGGNNAHVILEQHSPATAVARSTESTSPAPTRQPQVAIVGMGAVVGDATGVTALTERLFEGAPGKPRTERVSLPMRGLRFPPADLRQTLPQQLLLLQAAHEATHGIESLSRNRTSVIVGMGCDPEVARYGARWRTKDWVERWSVDDPEWRATAQDAFMPVLQSAGVLGTMPNIPANRLNSQFDLAGPSLTVSAEELSGVRALEVAARALRHGEIDAALVGAVDLSCEPVHTAALTELGEAREPGDAAVVLVLMRLDDARRDGQPILALLSDRDGPTASAETDSYDLDGERLGNELGHAHAAFGLLQVAAATLACRERRRLGGEPLQSATVTVRVDALGGASSAVTLEPDPSASPAPRSADPAAPADPHMLEMPAHLPEVTLPAFPGADARPPAQHTLPLQPGPGVQAMPLAPTLPPILERRPRAQPRSPDATAVTRSAAAGQQPERATPAPRQPGTRPVAAPPGAVDRAAPAPTPIAANAPAQPAAERVASPLRAAAEARTATQQPAPVQPSLTTQQAAPSLPPGAGQTTWLADAHRQFLASQTEAHQRFLEMRFNSMRTLLRSLEQLQGSGPTGTGSSSALAPPSPLQGPWPTPPAPPTSAAVPAAAPAAAPAQAAPAQAAPAQAAPAQAAPAQAAPAQAAPAQAAPSPAIEAQTQLPGLKLGRDDLEVHSSGEISAIYGPMFAQQDGFERQVRMPEPPLLLADRVVGLDAEPGSMGRGTIWTETDIENDSWYLHDGRMPAGIMIESGQADLMLISYLGIDFLNKGDRVYRLLGCELTYSGGLPHPGDTLRYDIHVDGHANQGDIRLFFFHYDCKVDGHTRLKVRQGQAGFFTDAELADSMGILWEAETGEHCENPRLDPPEAECQRTSFSHAQLEAFAAGRVRECFGPGFELASTHTRTPRISGGRMLFLDEVTHLERSGGPWGRGYLRAVDPIRPDDWFFDGHFKNDPCMPGTLMFEGCLQAMAFYIASLGYTLDRDGWRFEPVPDETYSLRCRGQVQPSSKELIYEIFVEEVIDGPYPTLYADLLCTSDGLKAFHCRRMGLRLVPSWPLDSRPELLAGYREQKPVASAKGFAFDYASLLACAWGRPSDAFGEMYAVFDDTRRVARLPGPPYHFMTRVTKVDGEIGVAKSGAVIELEYDIPHDEWYFRENGYPTMPFAVLLEAALQPCGWLASFVGSACTTETDLFFRNLDGTGTLLKELVPTFGTLRTVVKITNISASAGMLIESFDVACYVEDDLVYDLKTVFGFFPKEALANQVGLPVDDEARGFFDAASDYRVDLTTRPARYCSGSARLATPYLLMLDRVTGRWPEAGEAGLGRYRAEKDVDCDEWFFKAHFFQDPVQPGSLGLEAMLQLLQFAMLDKGMDEGIESARFEPLELGRPMSWKYRGQVRIHNEVITTTLEITEEGEDDRGRYAVGRASLWVDGKRIYEGSNLGMRIVPGDRATVSTAAATAELASDVTTAIGGGAAAAAGEVLHPAVDTWLLDHRPTWTVPALPMMSMVERLAAAAVTAAVDGQRLVGLSSVQVKRWLPIDEPTPIRTEIEQRPDGLRVTLTNDDGPIATGVAKLAATYPAPPEPLPALDAPEADNPYATGTLFHGPEFQLLRTLRVGADGSSAVLDAGHGSIPRGLLNQALLDAATHGIPHDGLDRWSTEISSDDVAYPAMLTDLTLHGPTPTTGEVRCETRFDGFLGGPAFPAFRVQLITGGGVWASFRLIEALFPKGPIGRAEPGARRAFLRDRQYVPGVALSTTDGTGSTTLDDDDVQASDWLPGTIAALYGTTDTGQIALKEHLAARVALHPGALPEALPLNRIPTSVIREGARVTVTDAGAETLDVEPVRQFWRSWFGLGHWPLEDVYYSLLERFVRRVVVVDPEAFAAVRGRSVLYLANHQVGVESLLFSITASALHGVPTATIAKKEHTETWLGRLIAHGLTYPGVQDPGSIVFFDRADPASLPRLLQELAQEMASEAGKSVMIHAAGTRSVSCRQPPVDTMSGVPIELATKVGAPIIPVRFVGGLPTSDLTERIEFPVGMGSQDYWIGRPILPEELAALPYGERTQRVLSALNDLGPDWRAEQPNDPDPELAAAVAEWTAASGASEAHAVIWRCLEAATDVCDGTRRLIEAVRGGRLEGFGGDDGPWLAELGRRLAG